MTSFWPNRDPFLEPGFEIDRNVLSVQLRRFMHVSELLEGADLYTIVGNNAVNYYDPLGLGFGGVWHPNQSPPKLCPSVDGPFCRDLCWGLGGLCAWAVGWNPAGAFACGALANQCSEMCAH